MGDADGNDAVDIEDALLVLQVASGSKAQWEIPYFANADVDCDEKITIFDARQILRCTAGLTTLEPTGAFMGFEGNAYGDHSKENAQKAIEIFNFYLNNIKDPETETLNAGFTKSEVQALYLGEDGLNIGTVEVFGTDMGKLVDEIAAKITEKISESDADKTGDVISKGSSCYENISVEGQTYVSQLTADDVCGIRFNIDYETMIATIEVALYDTVMEKAAEKDYDKVLDTERMVTASTGTLSKIVDYTTSDPIMTREFRNCVLKVEILLDEATGGRVISYTISYDEYAYVHEATLALKLSSVSSLLSGKVKIKNTEMTRYHIIEYTNFQW